MQRIERPAKSSRKGVKRPRKKRGKLYQRKSPSAAAALHRIGEPTAVQPRSQSYSTTAGNQFPARGIRRAAILGQQVRKCNGCVQVDHRSRRFSSSSPRILSSGATGKGTGGGPEAVSAGGVSTPDRIAFARRASARIGLRSSLRGPSSATPDHGQSPGGSPMRHHVFAQGL